ncbi:hypothetical protein BS47DRAFT_1368698 [Hydnum rufescens UP504]|uniref:Uncharacterized protein n=1 Tax=Hydnum rufescens UP504 TaxID=1448309 RepID=A0A9P6AEW6_9AGAM|nr:hypothetical protein BS47DRAFT_1368698 [Hydnum rufescens UP504]
MVSDAQKEQQPLLFCRPLIQLTYTILGQHIHPTRKVTQPQANRLARKTHETPHPFAQRANKEGQRSPKPQEMREPHTAMALQTRKKSSSAALLASQDPTPTAKVTQPHAQPVAPKTPRTPPPLRTNAPTNEGHAYPEAQEMEGAHTAAAAKTPTPTRKSTQPQAQPAGLQDSRNDAPHPMHERANDEGNAREPQEMRSHTPLPRWCGDIKAKKPHPMRTTQPRAQTRSPPFANETRATNTYRHENENGRRNETRT